MSHVTSLLLAQLQVETLISQDALRRFFRGARVQPATRRAIVAALRTRGLLDLVPTAHRDAA